MYSYLEDVMNKAKNDLSTRLTMLCKDFNIKQLESGSWLTFDDLNNEEKYELKDLSDNYAIGRVDLSSTTDLTAAVLVVIKNGKKYVIPHFFMPSEVIEKRKEEDNVPYDIWVNEMKDSGFDMEEVRQGVFSLSEPMKQLEADLKNHIVIYDDNPVLKWCFANTQAKVDVNGNI